MEVKRAAVMFLTLSRDEDGKEDEEKKRIALPGSRSRAVHIKAKGEGLGRGVLSRRSWGCDRDEDVR